MLKAAKIHPPSVIFLSVCAALTVQAATTAPCPPALSVRWVITARLGLGRNTSTRVHLDPLILTLAWAKLRTARPALQVAPR